MLSIKLRPTGKKHQRTFRIVVAEKRSKLNGRFVADLGWIDSHRDAFEVNKEEAQKWIGFGAQPTDTVHNILVKAGVIQGPKIPVHGTKKKKEGEETAPEAKAEVAAPTEEGASEEKSVEPEVEAPQEKPEEDAPQEESKEETEQKEEEKTQN